MSEDLRNMADTISTLERDLDRIENKKTPNRGTRTSRATTSHTRQVQLLRIKNSIPMSELETVKSPYSLVPFEQKLLPRLDFGNKEDQLLINY
jgi:hypothetical protein